jgi:hypothetical protein
MLKQKTVIEGTVYYDAKDEAKRVAVNQERNLIIGQMLEEKQRNEHGNRRRKTKVEYHCDTMEQ